MVKGNCLQKCMRSNTHTHTWYREYTKTTLKTSYGHHIYVSAQCLPNTTQISKKIGLEHELHSTAGSHVLDSVLSSCSQGSHLRFRRLVSNLFGGLIDDWLKSDWLLTAGVKTFLPDGYRQVFSAGKRITNVRIQVTVRQIIKQDQKCLLALILIQYGWFWSRGNYLVYPNYQ